MIDYESIVIGQKVAFEEVITREMHEAFSKLSGDYSPIHTNGDFSQKGGFASVIGYGFMLNCFLSKLYGQYLPGGSSICIKQDCKFIKPYYIGDTIKVEAEVKSKSDSTRFVEIDTKMYRQGNECIFRGSGLVQVRFERKKVEPLYKTESGFIYYDDFVSKLQDIGISKGDTVFIHSDISVFGKLATRDRNYLLSSIINSIKDVIGEAGTMVMPTFSYSFCNKEVYDVENTRTSVGILNEYFRKQEGVLRNLHPIFSVATYGEHKNDFLDISKDCFDENSAFGKLHRLKGKIVFFGADFQACTYLHYIEQYHGIPYRYLKTFEGIIRENGREYEDSCTYLVRYLDSEVVLDVTKLKKYLLENKFMRQTKIGDGIILTVDADVLFDEGNKLLDTDISYFLK